MQKINFYIDDAGVLHNNAPGGVFVYAGLCFLDNKGKESASRRYHAVALQIKNGAHIDGEVKASKLEPKHKGSLFSTISQEDLIFLKVNNHDVRDTIMDDKKSIHRYKDYILKRIVKQKIIEYVEDSKIDIHKDICINLMVDEQGTATNGVYNLQSSIYEELKSGISNFDYGKFFPPIFPKETNVEVHVLFCDSATNTLIRAADIVANRVWYSYVAKRPELRRFSNTTFLIFP